MHVHNNYTHSCTYVRTDNKEGVTVRIDTGVFEGANISIHYDPMISKLCTHAATRCYNYIWRARISWSEEQHCVGVIYPFSLLSFLILSHIVWMDFKSLLVSSLFFAPSLFTPSHLHQFISSLFAHLFIYLNTNLFSHVPAYLINSLPSLLPSLSCPLRQQAISVMENALDEYVVSGLGNNIPFLRSVFRNQRYRIHSEIVFPLLFFLCFFSFHLLLFIFC